MIGDPDKVVEIVATLKPEDFYDPVHRDIFDASRTLYEERAAIDFLTVADRLKGNSRVEAAGGPAYLAELCANVPVTSHADEYARIVKKKLFIEKS